MSGVKVFKERESPLTNLINHNIHIRSAFNMMVSFAIVVFIATFSYYLIDTQELKRDIEFGKWLFTNFDKSVIIWLCMQVAVLIPWYSVQWFRNVNKIVFTIMYMLFMTAYLLCPLFAILQYKFTPFSLFALTMEQLRFMMKIHSFTVEIFYNRMDAGKDKRVTIYNLIYFMFSPTLIYRHNYPRTKERSLQRACLYFMQFFGALFCIFASLRRFVKNFETVGLESYDAGKCFYLFVVGGCCGILLMFLGWYGLLQCWMNGWAEVIRFGDRMFYDEWWTSQYSKYFRKWNLVVSDWLLTYCYSAVYKLTHKSWLSALFTFTVSGIFHEYIVTLAWGFYLPVMFVLFLGAGVLMYFIHKNMKADHNGANMFMFGSMFIGWSLLIICYSIEWYSRINCPPVHDNKFWDQVTPRMFSCFKFNLNNFKTIR